MLLAEVWKASQFGLGSGPESTSGMIREECGTPSCLDFSPRNQQGNTAFLLYRGAGNTCWKCVVLHVQHAHFQPFLPCLSQERGTRSLRRKDDFYLLCLFLQQTMEQFIFQMARESQVECEMEFKLKWLEAQHYQHPLPGIIGKHTINQLTG